MFHGTKVFQWPAHHCQDCLGSDSYFILKVLCDVSSCPVKVSQRSDWLPGPDVFHLRLIVSPGCVFISPCYSDDRFLLTLCLVCVILVCFVSYACWFCQPFVVPDLLSHEKPWALDLWVCMTVLGNQRTLDAPGRKVWMSVVRTAVLKRSILYWHCVTENK